jgi:hypothetical protein
MTCASRLWGQFSPYSVGKCAERLAYRDSGRARLEGVSDVYRKSSTGIGSPPGLSAIHLIVTLPEGGMTTVSLLAGLDWVSLKGGLTAGSSDVTSNDL